MIKNSNKQLTNLKIYSLHKLLIELTLLLFKKNDYENKTIEKKNRNSFDWSSYG